MKHKSKAAKRQIAALAATQDKPWVTEGNPRNLQKKYRATTVATLKTACIATVVALYLIYGYRGFLCSLTLASVTHGLSWVAAPLLFAASRLQKYPLA